MIPSLCLQPCKSWAVRMKYFACFMVFLILSLDALTQKPSLVCWSNARQLILRDFWPQLQPQCGVEYTETAHSKSGRKQSERSEKSQNWEEIIQKIFLYLFGSVRPEFEPHFSKIPESSGTLRPTGFCPTPVTGQKPALTPYLTTIRKLHNRV